MKKSEEDHLKSTISESTLSTADAVPLPQWGRLREGGFAAKKEANLRCGLKNNVRCTSPLFVIPSVAEGSFSFPVSVFLRKAVCMRRRTPKSHEARCFPFPRTPHSLCLTANEKDFSLSLEMTVRGKRFAIGKPAFSLLPLEGGAPKRRRLASVAD